MKREKDLTEKAVKKELRGYYYAGVHQYEGECDEDKFVDIVCCDQYGVTYESCYDGWDYIIRKVPDYEDVRGMESQIKRLQKQLNDANEVIKKYAEFNNWEGDDKDQHDMTHFVGEDIGCGWSLATDYLEKWGVK